MMDGVTFEANIAKTCCNPNGIACPIGGVAFGSPYLISDISFPFIVSIGTCQLLTLIFIFRVID
jgi:hypothetical protein